MNASALLTFAARRRLAGVAMLLGSSVLVCAQLDPMPQNPPADRPIDPPSMPSAPMPSRPAEDFKSSLQHAQPTRATQRVLGRVSMASGEAARLSYVAAERASHNQVRSFADQVASSSRALEQEIDQLAIAKNVNVPAGKAAEEAEDWRDKDSSDFDEDYVRRTVKLHEDAIEAIEEYIAQSDADAEITAVGRKHLPGLREHLRQAQSLRRQVD